MTINGHYLLCFKMHASFGVHYENLKKDRHKIRRQLLAPKMQIGIVSW